MLKLGPASKGEGAKMAKNNQYSSEQIDAKLFNERVRLFVALVVAFFVGLSIFVLALTPLAKAVAGQDTNFTLDISIAINVALAVSTVCGGAGCAALNSRRRHHYRRAQRLEARVEQLQAGGTTAGPTAESTTKKPATRRGGRRH